MIFKVSVHLETGMAREFKTFVPPTPICQTPPRPTAKSATKHFQFGQVVNSFEGSLLRFTDRQGNGFNHNQQLQYFFPERDEATNQNNGGMYPSKYRYRYTPRTPLKIVNVKSFTREYPIDSLPKIVHEYFTHNGSREVVRSKSSDNLTIDNAFYQFIFNKIRQASIPNVDGVYMPVYKASHEELVLCPSGLEKLEYTRTERPDHERPVHLRTERPDPERKKRRGIDYSGGQGQPPRSNRRRTTFGRKIDFGTD